MAISYKVLGQVVPASGTLTTLYTAPASTQAVCSTLTVCNLSASALVRVAVRPAGASIDPKHYIVYDSAVNANDSMMLTLGIALSSSDVVSVQSTNSSSSFNLFGSELT